MPKVAIVAALEREVGELIRNWNRVEREYEGRKFTFFEREEMVVVCGGIGLEAARRAAEAVITLYRPSLVQSVGFAGALDAGLGIGDIFAPAALIDARDGSRVEIEGECEKGTLVTFMEVAGINQKAKLAQAYGAQAVDMEASAVAAAAQAHGIKFGTIKVISDDLDFEMPEMARFIDSQGRFRAAGFALFAAPRPWLWPRLAALARNSRKAARALGEHLERLRQELSQEASGEITSPPVAERADAETATTSGFRAEGHE
jgi:adenosylhomocysteine nucleosidase